MRHATMAVAALLFASACTDEAPEWCPADVAVRLAGEPEGWDGPLQLAPAWRVDGDDAGSELLAPTGIALRPDVPRIAVADFGLGEIAMISQDGEWIGRWGRRGRGPGELALPAAVAWRADGALVVFDPGNTRVVVFDSTGAVAEEEQVGTAFMAALGGGAGWMRTTASGTLLAQPGPRFQEQADDGMRTFAVVRGQDAGAVVDTLVSTRLPVAAAEGMAPMAAPGWQRPVAALHGDSIHATAGDQPEYIVRTWRGDAPAHVICRDVAALPYADEERTDTDENVPDFVVRAIAEAPTPETPGSIGRLVYDADGRLWVERTRPRALSGLDAAAGRAGALLDVYDADGTFLGEVRMPPDVRFLGATSALVVGLESSDLGVLSIVGYRPGW